MRLSGKMFSAADYIELGIARKAAIAESRVLLHPFDAMIYPTVAVTAPTIAEADASDEAYRTLSMRLVRNTGLVNILDGCAISIPCHLQGDAPVGLSVVGKSGDDQHILAVASTIEKILASRKS